MNLLRSLFRKSGATRLSSLELARWRAAYRKKLEVAKFQQHKGSQVIKRKPADELGNIIYRECKG